MGNITWFLAEKVVLKCSPTLTSIYNWKKKAKSNFERHFFKVMSNSVFQKKNGTKSNYHTTKHFSEKKPLAIEMSKTNVEMNKPVHLVLPIILDISKIAMYQYCYD